jgi:hypothetical protein
MFLKRCSSKRLISILFLAISWVVIVTFFYYYDYVGFFGKFGNLQSPKIGKCELNPRSPDLYFLKTKLNVGFDAGQLFHMTENYLVYHSILENANRLSNSSTIYFIFDQGINSRLSSSFF